MGMYTELRADLRLKHGTTTQYLLDWLADNDCELPSQIRSYDFFSCSRKNWFHIKHGPCETNEGVQVSIRAELKNYESEIEKLYEIIKPLYISGTYHSLYEGHLLWFDHVADKYIGPDGACEYCGEVASENHRCM